VNRLSGLLGSIGVVLATLAGCGGSDLVLPGNGTAADLQLVNGNNQKGPAGSPLAQLLEVRVLDDRGNALSGHPVSFALDTDAPGAQLDPESAQSGGDGIAQSRWTLGATKGTQSVVARVTRDGAAEPLEVRFSATVDAAGASRIEVVSGDDQAAAVGTSLPAPLIVRVVDGFGNLVEGVSVSWSAEAGSVSPASSVTGEDGRAATSWTLGSSSGSQSASASSTGLSGSPVGFTARANAGGANRLERVSGDGQSDRPGSALENPLVVRLVDNAGNGVRNRAVSWVVATGGGTTEPGTSTTDDDGRASTRWTLGPGEGQNTLNAVVSGVGVVGFSATAANGGGGGGGGGSRASRLEFLVQPTDTEEDERISPPVEVVVLDQAGNRVTDGEFEVKLELRPNGDGDDRRGKLKGRRTERTQAGVARFSDLEVDREGEYRLRASAQGLPSVESAGFEVEDD
jgi:hypothetical protein